MVFQGKIPDETRAFVRIAKKYRGMRQSEIMERCGVSRSTVYSRFSCDVIIFQN